MIKKILAISVVLVCLATFAWAEYDYEVGDIYIQDGKKYQVISITPDKMQIIVEPYKEPSKPDYEQEYYRQLLIEKGWLE